MPYETVCPCCGRKIYIDVRETGQIDVQSFCISNANELIKTGRVFGLEFGVNTKGGGEEDGQANALLEGC